MDVFMDYAAYQFALAREGVRQLVGVLFGQIFLHCGSEFEPIRAFVPDADALIVAAAEALQSQSGHVDARMARLDPHGARTMRLFYKLGLSLREAGSFTRAFLDFMGRNWDVHIAEVARTTPVVALLLSR